MTRTSIVPVLAVLFSACSSSPPPAPRAFVEHQAALPASPEPAPQANTANVVIAKDIREACGISESEAFFAYDSSRVREKDRGVLKKLADCFTTGPLKGREMRLVGHTDPRGDEEYNYLLGQRRADSVKSAIVTHGMPERGVATTSRGENEAAGSDETSWSKDRRVDVLLGS